MFVCTRIICDHCDLEMVKESNLRTHKLSDVYKFKLIFKLKFIFKFKHESIFNFKFNFVTRDSSCDPCETREEGSRYLKNHMKDINHDNLINVELIYAIPIRADRSK